MRSLELILLLLSWLVLVSLLARAIPFSQYKNILLKTKEKQELLSAKTACDILFLDSSYQNMRFNISAESDGRILHGRFYEEKCVASDIQPGQEGIRVTGEKQWYK